MFSLQNMHHVPGKHVDERKGILSTSKVLQILAIQHKKTSVGDIGKNTNQVPQSLILPSGNKTQKRNLFGVFKPFQKY